MPFHFDRPAVFPEKSGIGIQVESAFLGPMSTIIVESSIQAVLDVSEQDCIAGILLGQLAEVHIFPWHINVRLLMFQVIDLLLPHPLLLFPLLIS